MSECFYINYYIKYRSKQNFTKLYDIARLHLFIIKRRKINITKLFSDF